MGDLQNLFALPLSNLNKIGILSQKKMTKIEFSIISSQILSATFHLIVFFPQFFYMENDIEPYVENVEGVAVYVQFLGKLLSLLYSKKKFLELIEYATKHFWTTRNCSKIVQQSTKKLSDRILFVQKIFINLLRAAIIFAWLKTIITKQLAIGHWSMDRGNLFIVACVTMLLDGIMLVFTVGVFDSLYLAFCYEAIIQCKILYDHLERLSVKEITSENDLKNYYKKLQSCIKHHTLLLRYQKKLQDIYSVPLLIEYVTASAFTCIEMYAISEVSNLNSLVMSTNYLLIAAFQLIFYCYTSQHLTDELASISDAVYNSDWYSQHFKIVRAPNLLLMQRAQQKITINACGLVIMDLETLVKLFKFCLSTCLTLKGLKA